MSVLQEKIMLPDHPDKHLAAALGRIPSGLYILTMAHGGQTTGMLASWVQQCSFKPPQLTVAVHPGRAVSSWLSPGALFTLNILEEAQTDMIAHFGKGFAPDEDAFQGLDVRRDGPGGPILSEALAVLECRVAERFSVGDHDLVVAQVTAGQMLDEGQPMVHVRKNGLHY